MNFLARLPGLVRGHGGASLAVAALFLFTAAFESAVLPLAFRVLIDDVITPRNEGLLLPLLAALGIAAVIYAAVQIARDVLHARVSQALLAQVRDSLYTRLQRQSVGFHSRSAPANLVAHFTTDLTAVEQSLALGIPWYLTGVLGLCISGALLFTLEWRLALLALGGLALSTVGPIVLGRRASRASLTMREEQARFASRVHEDLAAHQTVLAFGLHATLLDRFRRNLARYLQLSVRAQVLAALVERTPNIAMLAFNIAVLVVGSVLVFYGSMTIGSLVSFYALSTGLAVSVASTTWALPYFLAADAGLTRIDAALSGEVELHDRAHAALAHPLRTAIELDRVTFGYAAERPNLRELTLQVPARAFCAFVGPSGCGKSTVLNLVMRFFDVQGGALRWDGTDVRDLTEASLRRQMAVVFQDNVVFHDTIRENLRIGDPTATDDAIWAALRDAELLDAVERAPQGLDTVLGEGAMRLSGGQRQRLAIARALLRDPSVLILDEATSALDPAAESMINETLRRIGRSRTVLSVTHRLSAAATADCIFALQDGRLAQSGTHDELLAAGGVYAELWAKQSGFQVNAGGDWATVGADRLRLLPLLADLPAGVLEELSAQFQPEIYQADREVVHEGDPGDRFYLIARGELEVLAAQADGSPRKIAVLRDGDYFGEVALLRDQPRSATVRTVTPAVLLSLRRRHFATLLQATPELRIHMESEAARRLTALA